MKSIKEKAKAYDESLERAKGVIEQNPLMEYLKKGIEYIFPELKESEDERIRKHIMEVLRDNFSGKDTDKCITWLEKQGNLVKYYEDKLDRCACDNFNKGYKKALEKQGEQKPADIPEDFEKLVEHLLSLSDGEGHGSPAKVKEVSAELLRLANQQTPAWSEEDEAMWTEISDLLWEGYKQSGSKFSWDDIRNWVNPKLKSLTPQSTWKPSDEQIGLLQAIVNEPNNAASESCQITLKEVIKQLKKLMEE